MLLFKIHVFLRWLKVFDVSVSSYFTKSIISWYKKNKRDLPWRESTDPYFIWLSEILLQQTRVSQGLPYYYNFITAYPDIHSLAKASETEVLKLWEGLGYYSRARNLHKTARYISEVRKGVFPDNYKELLQLPGIGPYTAAAIASFAFNEKVAVVDGNVYRVLSRVFGIATDIGTGQGVKEFAELAASLLPGKQTDVYNQGIMEFGALHCTPASPKCETCPLLDICCAKAQNKVSFYPVKNKKNKKTNRYFNYILFKNKDNYYLRERKVKDIWQGLFEFYLYENSEILSIDSVINSIEGTKGVKFTIRNESPTYKHVLSHQNIFAKIWEVEFQSVSLDKQLRKNHNLLTFNKKEIESIPKPVLLNKFLNQYFFN